MIRILATILVFAATTSLATAQSLHALVVGIDKYKFVPVLPGAGEDADDLAQTLKPIVQSLIVLRDEAATRDGVMSGWKRLVATAKTGDTLLWTFAGHGTRAPGPRREDRPEWLDGRLVMVGWDGRSAQGRKEEITHQDLDEMFDEAGKRGLRVVFVADSCHSGAVTRSIDGRAGGIRFRFVPSYDVESDLDKSLVAQAPAKAPPNSAAYARPEHVTFIAAAQPDQLVPEVPINGVARGVVSWSLARALEGAKLVADDDGQVTRGALGRFILQNVRTYAEGRQTPETRPKENPSEVLFRIPLRGQTAQPVNDNIRFSSLGLDSVAAGSLLASLKGVAAVSGQELPEMIWDAAKGDVLNGASEVIAFGVPRSGLQAVVDKQRALYQIKALGLGAGLDSTLTPGDGIHPEGRELTWRAGGLRHPHLIVFSIAGDGTVQYLFPQGNDPKRVDIRQPRTLSFTAGKPYGADHLVVITAERFPTEEVAALQGIDGQKDALKAARLVQQITARGGYQVALQALFTGPKQ
jgi:hypothetical protein